MTSPSSAPALWIEPFGDHESDLRAGWGGRSVGGGGEVVGTFETEVGVVDPTGGDEVGGDTGDDVDRHREPESLGSDIGDTDRRGDADQSGLLVEQGTTARSKGDRSVGLDETEEPFLADDLQSSPECRYDAGGHRRAAAQSERVSDRHRQVTDGDRPRFPEPNGCQSFGVRP